MFDTAPKRILWCYGIEAAKPDIKGVVFHNGLPTVKDIKRQDMVILDDLMHESGKSNDVTAMFTRCVHHLRIFLVMIVQNLFHQNKEARTRHLNTHYIVLFKSPRDCSAVQALARQMYPGCSRFLTDAYRDATQKPHTYLLLDFQQETQDKERVLTHIFPDERTIAYINTLNCK